MFARARLRLTLLYIVLFALIFGVFSVIFYVVMTIALQPDFDLAPEVSSLQASELAYQTTVERMGVALLIANILVVGIVGLVAWVLATRTLRPIREAHLRQRRFVADASHEMRTPLAAIRATAESAAEGVASPETLRSALQSVVASTDRLTRLTNDLLLLARTDERLLAPAAEQVDLSVVAAEAVEESRATWPLEVKTKVALAPDLLVAADPDDLRRILANLLDNAARHGGPTVHIGLTTFGSEREALLEVEDDGPGIGPAEIGRIFEPFYRVRADAASPDGTGLGLALAQSLAERSGGRLSVESMPGVGSRFRLSLPRVK
ncbi:MAG: two-component system, OmpR family, sensor kinase [Chloroflexota bacterium]|nr:two-component system, OmpR family, sensor kinase [Chloroflexota bacterium]